MADIVGVLLAAGRGMRFGGNKLLAALPDGTPIAVAAARHLRASLPNSLVVVREDDDPLRQHLSAEGLRIVVNPYADGGMSTSIACGVAAAEADGWVVALADMPTIQPKTIQIVTDALTAGALLAAPAYRGQRGHPIGFARRFRTALTSLCGDQGGRDILIQHTDELYLIEVDDPGVLHDIDRVADLAATTRWKIDCSG